MTFTESSPEYIHLIIRLMEYPTHAVHKIDLSILLKWIFALFDRNKCILFLTGTSSLEFYIDVISIKDGQLLNCFK